jgi:hypothetical protein
MTSNLLLLRLDLILKNNIKPGVDKPGEDGVDLILEYHVLSKTVLLILQYEVSCFLRRENSFLFPEIEVLLNEFLEADGAIFPHT